MFCSKSLWKSGIAPANNLLRCINTPVSRATPRFDRIFGYLGRGHQTAKRYCIAVVEQPLHAGLFIGRAVRPIANRSGANSLFDESSPWSITAAFAQSASKYAPEDIVGQGSLPTWHADLQPSRDDGLVVNARCLVSVANIEPPQITPPFPLHGVWTVAMRTY